MGQVDFAYDTLAGKVCGAPFVSIFADRQDLREQMREDAEAAGMILRECGGLGALLGDSPRPLGEAVLIDCPVSDCATVAALNRIDGRVLRSGAHLVVSTSLDGLNDVFACFSQCQPQILVSPRRADRIIALGQMLTGVPNSRLRELSDDDRLKLLRLTEQVSQIAEKLERLGDGEDIVNLRSPGQAFRFGEQAGGTLRQHGDRLVAGSPPPLPDPRVVRRVIQQRQLRARFFDGELFADPAWDMLLDLTAARAENKRVYVTSLCIASGVPPTTALRWISQLTEVGLFERVEDETDRRRAFLQLSDKASDAMARYFAELGKGVAALV